MGNSLFWDGFSLCFYFFSTPLENASLQNTGVPFRNNHLHSYRLTYSNSVGSKLQICLVNTPVNITKTPAKPVSFLCMRAEWGDGWHLRRSVVALDSCQGQPLICILENQIFEICPTKKMNAMMVMMEWPWVDISRIGGLTQLTQTSFGVTVRQVCKFRRTEDPYFLISSLASRLF